MKIAIQYKPESIMVHEAAYFSDLAKASFAKIAPFWPLANLIAVNPLQGFEDLPIEDALKIGATYFQKVDLPQEMEIVNIETIKWLQPYFDEGQSTISMPFRENGLYQAWRKLALYDDKLFRNNIQQHRDFLCELPEMPEQAIATCLMSLGIDKKESEQFLTLLLTTLPGWAAYIKYRTEWGGLKIHHTPSITQVDYIAVRLIITSLLWPQARKLLNWHRLGLKTSQVNPLKKIQIAEKAYRLPLLKKLSLQPIQAPHTPEAQIVFCIDVRSEPFRRALESTGNYQTLGFAGFFGIPVKVTDVVTGDSNPSCPVLISPKHEVKESPRTEEGCLSDQKGYERLTTLKQLYQSTKYTFTTPFALVEALGFFSGVWMGFRTFFPNLASRFKNLFSNMIRPPQELESSLNNITIQEQCAYAESALRMMGFTQHFAPLVVLCGHGSTTQNNAYATALDCGACGGQHGGSNARILAAIMNRVEVRTQLAKNGINIPENTCFIAAEHNTTTDEITLYNVKNNPQIHKLKTDLLKARGVNNLIRLRKLRKNVKALKMISDISIRAQDWAQIRPEWGLARNSAFIVAPRDITFSLDLDGRCFLHSYNYKEDPQGSFLATILTAPMVVAHWINMQYLFSTIDNVAYGSGSKITKNITGKIGIMQGNASDLMTGLPLQSVYSSDTEPYHETLRLMTVVFAPRCMLDKVIHQQPVLKKLFGNNWVQIAAIEPDNRKIYLLNKDFLWEDMN